MGHLWATVWRPGALWEHDLADKSRCARLQTSEAGLSARARLRGLLRLTQRSPHARKALEASPDTSIFDKKQPSAFSGHKL